MQRCLNGSITLLNKAQNTLQQNIGLKKVCTYLQPFTSLLLPISIAFMIRLQDF